MAITNDQITAKNFKKFYDAIEPYLNGATHAGYTPVGSIVAIMGNAAPPNYLVCDGEIYNIADYPELATYFEQQFEVKNFFGGDGTTTFAVPDLRGEFLRGTGTNSHTNQGSGGDVGEHQDGTSIPKVYGNDYTVGIGNISGGSSDAVVNPDSELTAGSGFTYSNKAGVTSVAKTNFTSRPTNTSVLYCIATKNIFIDTHDMADTVDAEDVADIIAENPPVARNNYQKYATYEQVVGEWIDGKPLYQITIAEAFNMPANGYHNWTIPSGIDNIIDVKSKIADSGNIYYGNINFQNFYFASSGSTTLRQDNKSAFYTEGNKTNYLTIQYTKTTD